MDGDLASLAGERVCAIATVDCARACVVYSTRVARRLTQQKNFCALVALLWQAGRPVLWCLPLAFCAPLSDLPVLFGGDPVVRARVAYGYPSSRTYPFTYHSYTPCFREGTWSPIRGSVGCGRRFSEPRWRARLLHRSV